MKTLFAGLLAFALTTSVANAVTITAGDVIRGDYDFTSDPTQPPYGSGRTSFEVVTAPTADIIASYEVFDSSGLSLATGTETLVEGEIGTEFDTFTLSSPLNDPIGYVIINFDSSDSTATFELGGIRQF